MSNIIELAAARVLERYFDTRIEMNQITSWGSEGIPYPADLVCR